MADITEVIQAYLAEDNDDMQDIMVTDVLVISCGVRMTDGSEVIQIAHNAQREIVRRGLVDYLNEWVATSCQERD